MPTLPRLIPLVIGHALEGIADATYRHLANQTLVETGMTSLLEKEAPKEIGLHFLKKANCFTLGRAATATAELMAGIPYGELNNNDLRFGGTVSAFTGDKIVRSIERFSANRLSDASNWFKDQAVRP